MSLNPLMRRLVTFSSDQLNAETLIATIPDDPNPATSSTNLGRPLRVRGALKALQNKGIKIKNYKETGGAGRTITHRPRDEDEEGEE